MGHWRRGGGGRGGKMWAQREIPEWKLGFFPRHKLEKILEVKVAANEPALADGIAAIRAELLRRDREGEPESGPQFWRKGRCMAKDVVSSWCSPQQAPAAVSTMPTPSAPPTSLSAVATLVEMGFDAGASEAALAANGGSVERALASLVH